MGFANVAIVTVKGNSYRIHFWYINKDEATNLLKNVDLSKKKVDHYKIINHYKFFFIVYKFMRKEIIAFRNIEFDLSKNRKNPCKNRVSLEDVDIKNFAWVKKTVNKKKVKPLHTMLLKTSVYVKS